MNKDQLNPNLKLGHDGSPLVKSIIERGGLTQEQFKGLLLEYRAMTKQELTAIEPTKNEKPSIIPEIMTSDDENKPSYKTPELPSFTNRPANLATGEKRTNDYRNWLNDGEIK
jgi:hypothetical protein